jgi:hypothetical protein
MKSDKMIELVNNTERAVMGIIPTWGSLERADIDTLTEWFIQAERASKNLTKIQTELRSRIAKMNKASRNGGAK